MQERLLILSDGDTNAGSSERCDDVAEEGDIRGTVRGWMRMRMASEMLKMHLTYASTRVFVFPKCHTFVSGKQQLTNP